ncbi:MAG: glycoside hydrolase family 99-like domain-containing protein [Cyclobacteriaceae bacterium]
MKNVKNIFIILLALLMVACVDESVPTAEGTLLDFEVPDTPAEVNYAVGAHYVSFDWSNNGKETPAIGEYNSQAGDPTAYAQHITWAQAAGIDFFIFNLSSGADAGNQSTDRAFIDNLLTASGASGQNFAIAYSFTGMDLSLNNRIDVADEANMMSQLVDDFVAMADLFAMSNYQTASGGAKVLYIRNGNTLFAENYANVYQTLRSEVSTQLGVDLYIIGEQQEWTPPLRFEVKFKGGVDAISHRSYARISRQGNNIFYDRMIMFEQYADLALSTASDEISKINLNYIPQVSPSYDGTIVNVSNTDFVIDREEEWFRKFCDIAKRASGNNPENIIILDSFNDWNFDKQVEPAESYSTQFLDIVRDEFKLN